MKIKTKTVYGILSILPLAMWVIFMIVNPFIEHYNDSLGLFTIWDLYPGVLGKITVYTVAGGLFFALFMAIKVYQNYFVPKERRRLWIFLLVFGNVIFLPIFWLIYLRKHEDAGKSTQS